MKRCVIIFLLSLNAICICSQSLEIDWPNTSFPKVGMKTGSYSQVAMDNHLNIYSTLVLFEQSVRDRSGSLAWLTLRGTMTLLPARAHRYYEIPLIVANSMKDRAPSVSVSLDQVMKYTRIKSVDESREDLI